MGVIEAILRAKRGAYSWLSNQVLKSGEFAYEIDIKGLKIGDGIISEYNQIPYLIPPRIGKNGKYLKVENGLAVWADGVDTTQIWIAISQKQDIVTLENAVATYGFIKNTVNDLVNYYKKTETYTQAEVNALIGGISGFRYEIYASISAVTDPSSNVLYLIGPIGSGSDKYEEYVYSNNNFIKIGDTSIDLSNYVTTSELNTALANYTTTTDLTTLLSGYQTKIDSSHKLDYSLIDNTPTIPDAQIQSDWNQSDNTEKDYIKNKPTIPAAQIQSDWNQNDNTAKDYIKNKPTVHSIPAGGNAGQVMKKLSATDYDVYWANSSETLPSAYCTTSGSTAAKKANCSLYVTQANQYLQVLIGSANTYQGALTLNINSAGAKPIYINGTASSSSNYTLPNGTYFVFYDGTNYYFRTDGKLPMKDADFGGSYNDLADKPTIPAAQVNADWSANSGIAEILNKPTLGTAAALDVPSSGDASTSEVVKGDDSRLTDARTPTTHNHTVSEITDFPTLATVATSGDYDDLQNKPTIPAAQVNSDWNAISGVAQILNKPTIPDAVSGTNDGTNWTSITIGSDTYAIPSGGGGGGLSNYDFTELSAPTISGSACTITFAADQRNAVEFSTNADLAIALVSNNKADNYIWITNSHATTAIDITFSSILFGSTAINDIKGTASIPSVEAGETLEIGIYVTGTKARITSRIL